MLDRELEGVIYNPALPRINPAALGKQSQWDEVHHV